MTIAIDGSRVHIARDFHEQFARALDLGGYYGKNLDALNDVLRIDLTRPARLVWTDSAASRAELGVEFGKIQAVLDRIQQEDASWGREHRFSYELL